ncbi:MAG: plasmid mobilization protein [Porcipelethomonas sp.]
MSAKNLDSKDRFRSRTIGFRVSPEEDKLINSAVALSGLTKQDYIVKRLLNRDVVVQGNPRVYKALKNQLAEVLAELKKIENSSAVNDELLSTIQLITVTLDGMKGEK